MAVSKTDTMRCTVAPGRTVVIGEPGNLLAKPPIARTTKECGPGQQIELPRDEFEYLLTAGYLMNPDGTPPVPQGNGPDFNRDTTATTTINASRA